MKKLTYILAGLILVVWLPFSLLSEKPALETLGIITLAGFGFAAAIMLIAATVYTICKAIKKRRDDTD